MNTGLIPWQLASQIVLEVVIAAALWYWLLELTLSPTKLIVNPDAELLNTRLAALNAAMEPVRSRLAKAEGNLQEFSDSLHYWVRSAEMLFLAHEEREKRLTQCLAALQTAHYV